MIIAFVYSIIAFLVLAPWVSIPLTFFIEEFREADISRLKFFTMIFTICYILAIVLTTVLILILV